MRCKVRGEELAETISVADRLRLSSDKFVMSNEGAVEKDDDLSGLPFAAVRRYI
jgi:hypothetical protein